MKLGDIITQAIVARCGKDTYPVLSMTMHDGIVEQSGRFKKAIASKDTGTYKVVQPGQLVVGFPIDEGVIYVQNFDFPGIVSPAYNVWDINTNVVIPAYLELALHSPQSMTYYADKMRGTTARRRSITPENLRAMEIPVPDKTTQQSIVEAFARVRRLIAVAKEQIASYDELVKARFVEMFGDPVDNPKGWERACLDEVFVVGSAKRVYAEEQVIEGVPFLRLGDLTNRIQNGVDSCDLHISKEQYNRFFKNGFVPSPGDILVTARGTMGLCYIVSNGDKFYFQDGMITWLKRTDKSPASAFLTSLFGEPHFREDLLSRTSGTTVKYLSIKTLAKVPVIMPPKDLQEAFLSFAQQVDKLKSAAQQQINKLQELYDSLAQEYFGEERA